jgi:competence protein ComFC
MVNVKPIEIKGNWSKGYVLDIHTTSSIYLGDDEYGHPHFDTKRSELGELIIRLKYREDKSVIGDILETICLFLKNTWKITDSLDFIIPVPPSKVDRKFQPVVEIAEKLSAKIHVPMCVDSLKKTKVTQELKDIVDFDRRKEILKDAFDVNGNSLQGKNILLIDDLFRSGATLQTITEVLYNKGKVKNVFVLTLTKTRSKK